MLKRFGLAFVCTKAFVTPRLAAHPTVVVGLRLRISLQMLSQLVLLLLGLYFSVSRHDDGPYSQARTYKTHKGIVLQAAALFVFAIWRR